MPKLKTDFTLFTDGACFPNPGPGAWAYILRVPNHPDIEEARFSPDTTNNRMELCAAIAGLEQLRKLELVGSVLVYTDSKYLIRGITEWIENWKRRDWRTAEGKPVLNQDLWQRLDRARLRQPTHWQWVKAHAGHVENERCDFLATECLAKSRPTPFLRSPIIQITEDLR